MSEDYKEATNRIKYDADLSQEISDSRRKAIHETRERRANRMQKVKNAARTALVMTGIAGVGFGGAKFGEAVIDGMQAKNQAVVDNALEQRGSSVNGEMSIPPEKMADAIHNTPAPPAEAPGPNPEPVDIHTESGAHPQ